MTFWFFDEIKTAKTERNDFMSHLAYIALIVFLGMLCAAYRIDDKSILAVVGVIVGLMSTLAREYYDEVTTGTWEARDILAGICGTTFAIICMSAY